MKLRVFEIFRSLQGESTRAGQDCLFVRLAGCDVHCGYCDTVAAQDPAAGRDLTVDEIMAELQALGGTALVEITGGEPLRQFEGVRELAARLLAAGKTVMLETSGAVDLGSLDPRVEVIMDVKTPGSGAAHRLCPENLAWLDGNDELKFVLTSRADYEWAGEFLARRPQLSALRAVHYSPCWTTLMPATLAGWMRQDEARPPAASPPAAGAPARLTVQLHKLLGVK